MENSKVCRICGIEKPRIEFYADKSKKGGYRNDCILCHNARNKVWRESNPETVHAYQSKWVEENREHVSEYHKQWSDAHKEQKAEVGKRYYRENKPEIKIKHKEYEDTHKEQNNATRQRWRDANLEKVKVYARNSLLRNKKKRNATRAKWKKHKRDTDPAFKILEYSRCRLWSALKGLNKSAPTLELLGIPSKQFLREYFESKFETGMTWKNQGYWGWHIDHIIPCDSFDMNDPEQQRRCFHYTNLQPLWRLDNQRKSNKIQGDVE